MRVKPAGVARSGLWGCAVADSAGSAGAGRADSRRFCEGTGVEGNTPVGEISVIGLGVVPE